MNFHGKPVANVAETEDIKKLIKNNKIEFVN